MMRSSIICTVCQILLCDIINEDEMFRACSMHGRFKMCTYLLESLKGIDHSEDLATNWILKWILRKWGGWGGDCGLDSSSSV
jgi:hypothetical protein